MPEGSSPSEEGEVPVLVDMASDLRRLRNLTRWIRAGADLVVVSGGKVSASHQSAGFSLDAGPDRSGGPERAPHTGIGRGREWAKWSPGRIERYRLDKKRSPGGQKARWLASAQNPWSRRSTR
jgi:hypothetical protein